AVLLLSAVAVHVHADITVAGGTLTGNTTWSDTTQTYLVDNESDAVVVPNGFTLTIAAGVTVESKNDNKETIVVEAGGILSATGATFTLKTRDLITIKPPLVVRGTATFTDCSLAVSQTRAARVDTTVLLLLESAGAATLSGTSLAASTSGLRVHRGVWVKDTATLTVTASAGNRSAFSDFPQAIWWESSSNVSIAGADFSDGTYAVNIDDPAVDVTVSNSTFTNYDRALNLPQAEDIALSNVTITQDSGTIDGQIGVYTRDYASFAISGAISNMYIGVHVSLAHQVDGTAAIASVTFTDCERDLLAEGDYSVSGSVINSNTTLTKGHYHVANPITIAAGATLTIDPGVILDTKVASQPMFVVEGALVGDQAIFEARLDYNDWLLYARLSGTITVTKCLFRGSSNNISDNSAYFSSFIRGGMDAEISVLGCEFVTAPSYFGDTVYKGKLRHAVRVEENAVATIDEAPDGTRTSMSGFWWAVHHHAETDLTVDNLDVFDCNYAFDCNTTGNVFLYNVNMTDNNNGLHLRDAGVLVTNGVVATNTPSAFIGTIPQILNPQISLVGMSFDDTSYCLVAGGYTFDADANMPVLPIRIDDRSGPVVIPDGFTVTFPAGSRLSNWKAGSTRRMLRISGTLNCTDTTMELWTYWNDHLIYMLDSGRANFTDCTIHVEDMYHASSGNSVIHAGGDSEVTLSGCTISTSDNPDINTPRFMYIRENAKVTVKAFDGTPCSFAEFRRGLECNTVANCPKVEQGTLFTGDALEYESYLEPTAWPGNKFTVSADATIECSDLTICNYYTFSIPAGVTVDIRPHSRIRLVYPYSRHEFQIAGELIADDVVFDLRTTDHQAGTTLWFLGDGAGTFTNCTFNVSETYSTNYRAGVLGATDNGQITLDGCTLESDSEDPVARALMLQGASRLNVPASSRASTTITGFQEAVYAPTLDVFGDTPGLVFGDNVRDIRFDGGTTITRDVVLPANSIIGAYVYYDPVTILPGISLTIPPGCVLDNYKVGNTTGDFDVFVAQGNLTATSVTFNVRTYCEDNGAKGTRVFDIEGSGTGLFTDCTFTTGDDYHNIRETALIAVSDTGTATIRGGSFESDPKYYDYATSHAVTLYDNATLSIVPYNDTNTTFRGFPRAITAYASTGIDISIGQALFREGGIGIQVFGAPLRWDLQGTTFIGNTTAAVSNGGDSTLDCRDNYWGHPSGPNHPSNPFGLGDAVIGDVLFVPYAATGLVTITTVGDHPVGQAPNAFTGTGDIANAVLLRFTLSSPEGSVPTTGFTVRLPHCEELEDANLTNVRLVPDGDADGLYSGSREVNIDFPGTINTTAKTITFPQSIDLEGDWLIVADLIGIASGDALSLKFDAVDILSDPGLFLSGACSAAKHFRDRLFLGDHSRGRINNGLLAATNQSGVTLTAMSTSPGYAMQALTVSLSESVGIVAANLRNVTLLVDADGDGEESFGEAIWPAELVQLAGATGQIDFAFGATPLATGTDLVVRCDFVDLRRDDHLKVQVTSGGITPVDPLVDVVGENASTRHIVPRPMLILDPAFQAADGFTAASILRSVPLLGFTIFPGGRQVREIAFSLTDVDGVEAGDLTNAKLRIDTNGDGVIGDGETETAGGTAVVDIDTENRRGTITFSEAFTVGGGDYLLMADVANLANDDMLTISLRSQNVSPGPNDTIEGGVTPVRHAVLRAELPTAAEQHNWTLTYRSPGGTTVTGSYSHDGTKVILGYSAGTAYLFDTLENRPLMMLHKHFDKVQYAGFSADDSLAITVTYDGAVYLWNAETGALERNLFSDLLVRYATPSPDASKLFIVTEG
ncbi:MAG: WD40 repeat domain-containing protein, partial [Lentisphaeria bacterium]|nr:WD40 repeat domain-containing protein [Lentisphaeria bacterium]